MFNVDVKQQYNNNSLEGYAGKIENGRVASPESVPIHAKENVTVPSLKMIISI